MKTKNHIQSGGQAGRCGIVIPVLVWMLTGAIAYGQTPQQTQRTSANDDILQEIVVTGTLIRGAAAPVGSSLITVDQADLQATGANSISDMLRDVPQISNLGVSESNRTGTGGAGNIVLGNSINLRGLSPFATLTLVNGHRVVPGGTVGGTVDPDALPSIMLQRVDVVADGASATYGSDAIAGVVNLVLRRDVEGLELNAREGWADDYKERLLGAMAGHNWGSGQITIGYENSYKSGLNGMDRNFFESNQTSLGGIDYRTNYCNPGTIMAGGRNYAIPAGGVTPATAGKLVGGTQNLCDTAKYADLLPEVERNNVALTLDQKIGESVNIYGDATYSKRAFYNAVAQNSGPLTVPNTNAYFVAPPGAALAPCAPGTGTPLCETVGYSFGNDLGNQAPQFGRSENYQFTLGANFKLGSNWTLGVDGTAGRDRDWSLFTEQLDNGVLATELASSNPATALNVFGGRNSAAVIDPLFADIFYAPGNTGMQVMEAKLDGSLFRLPGGDVRAALGGQWRHDTLSYGYSAGVPGPDEAIVNVRLDRISRAGYLELLVPLVGNDNQLPGIRSLELDLAGRYENYSQIGSTIHPKVGLDWKPIDEVKVHASYATSFRAPLLSELVGPVDSVYVQTYSDPKSPSGTSTGYTLDTSNPNLKPETATTWSLGLDYQPIQNAKVSFNFYHILYKNQIASYLSNLNILNQVDQLGSLINRCPSDACTSLINQYVGKIPLFGPILSNPSVFVNGNELNLGSTLTQGVDFEGRYTIPTDRAGKFSVGLTGTWTEKYDVQFAPGGGTFNELNSIGYPFRIRMRGAVGWTLGPVSLLGFVNYQPKYTNSETLPIETVSSYTTVDLNAIFDINAALPSVITKAMRVTVHVNNVFDRVPPYVNIPISPNGGGGFDPAAANPIGRLVSVGISKKF